MKEQKQRLIVKQVPIKHPHRALKTVLLMSVGAGAVMLFNKIANDPRRNFYVKKIGAR